MAFERLAERYDMPKTQARRMAAELVTLVKDHLTAGDRVRLTGLGTIEVKDSPARPGRNPRTGATIQIPAGKRVAFRPAVELRQALAAG
jgi:DNA-binding protein HU-beta